MHPLAPPGDNPAPAHPHDRVRYYREPRQLFVGNCDRVLNLIASAPSPEPKIKATRGVKSGLKS